MTIAVRIFTEDLDNGYSLKDSCIVETGIATVRTIQESEQYGIEPKVILRVEETTDDASRIKADIYFQPIDKPIG